MKRPGRAARRGPGLPPGPRHWCRAAGIVASPLEPRRPPGARPAAAPSAGPLPDLPVPFPTGQRPVPSGLRRSLPAAAKPGKPIQPTGVSLTMALPPAAVSALASLRLRDRERGHQAHRQRVGRPRRDQRRVAGGHRAPGPPAGARRPDLDHRGHGAVGDRVLARGRCAHRRWPLGLLHRGQGRRPAQPGTTPARVPPRAGPRAAGRGRPGPPARRPRPAPGPAPGDLRAASGPACRPGDLLVTGKAIRRAVTPCCCRGRVPKLPKGGLKLNPRFTAAAPPEDRVQSTYSSAGVRLHNRVCRCP